MKLLVWSISCAVKSPALSVAEFMRSAYKLRLLGESTEYHFVLFLSFFLSQKLLANNYEYRFIGASLLDAFVKLRKAIISFVM